MVSEKRNNLIDLLRIFAASCVALFHFNEPIVYINNWYRNFCKLGYLGVPVFFVVSGYCILIALEHAAKPTEFAIRRFFRIFPPYWFSLVVIIAIAVCEKVITGTNSVYLPKTAGDILATPLLLVSPVTHVNTMNWAYWTLPYEVIFYIIIFLLSYFRGKYFLILLIILNVLPLIVPANANGLLSFFGYLPMFGLGMAVYFINHKKQIRVSLILLALVIVDLYFSKTGLPYGLVSIITSALIFCNNFKPLAKNIFSKYGDVSYSLYLIHVPVGIFAFGFLKTNFQTNIALNIVFDIAMLLFLILFSTLMYKYIELPAIRFGKKIAK
jgi:peptidoglycan/LPS O-acetylase OafA/YrhL